MRISYNKIDLLGASTYFYGLRHKSSLELKISDHFTNYKRVYLIVDSTVVISLFGTVNSHALLITEHDKMFISVNEDYEVLDVL